MENPEKQAKTDARIAAAEALRAAREGLDAAKNKIREIENQLQAQARQDVNSSPIGPAIDKAKSLAASALDTLSSAAAKLSDKLK